MFKGIDRVFNRLLWIGVVIGLVTALNLRIWIPIRFDKPPSSQGANVVGSIVKMPLPEKQDCETRLEKAMENIRHIREAFQTEIQFITKENERMEIQIIDLQDSLGFVLKKLKEKTRIEEDLNRLLKESNDMNIRFEKQLYAATTQLNKIIAKYLRSRWALRAMYIVLPLLVITLVLLIVKIFFKGNSGDRYV